MYRCDTDAPPEASVRMRENVYEAYLLTRVILMPPMKTLDAMLSKTLDLFDFVDNHEDY